MLLASASAANAAPAATKLDLNSAKLEDLIREFDDRAIAFRGSQDFTKLLSYDWLEGPANRAVLANTIRALYDAAGRRQWQQSERLSVFSMEGLVGKTTAKSRNTLPTSGVKVALLSLQAFRRGASGRLYKVKRGVLLTSSFQALKRVDLQTMYYNGSIRDLVHGPKTEYQTLAEDLVEKLSSDNSRESRYAPVVGNALAWSVGCHHTISGRFCLNAKVFDAADTDPSVFYSALTGNREETSLTREIREQGLTWPLESSYIVRGYKVCGGCKDQHWGVDLTARVGTEVHAVDDGVVRAARTISGWGHTIVVEHVLPSGRKYMSLYGHLRYDSLYSRERGKKGAKLIPRYKVGDVIRRGQMIAYSGTSGRGTGPHLHLEIREIEDDRDPLLRPGRKKTDWPIDPLRVLPLLNVILDPDEKR